MVFFKSKSKYSYNCVVRVYSPRIINPYAKKTSRKWISAALIFLLIFQVIAGVFLPFNLKINPAGISLQKSLAAGEAWYNASWLYRKQISIDHTKVADVATPSVTYANFPVLISLDSLSNINANGTDIRFTSSDGVTELPREIESYSSGSLKAWVKTTLTKDSSDSTDDIIYMYYGNASATEPAASSAYGSQNVWKTDGTDTSTKMVQHMKDTTTSTITDSTSNANNGTKKAANEPIEATAQIAKGQTFDGTDDYVNAGNGASLKPALPITIEAWVYTRGSSNISIILASDGAEANYRGYWMYLSPTNTVALNFGDNTGLGPLNRRTKIGTTVLTNNSFYHIVGIIRGATDMSIYINGVDDGGTYSGTGGAINYGSGISKIGEANFYPAQNYWRFNGTIDEVRAYNRALTVQEITTQYNNENSPSTFYTISAEEYFDHLAITGTASMNAGSSQIITITAKTNLGNTYDGYTGDKSLTFSGASVSGAGNYPTCSDKTSADVNFGAATAVTFTSGIAICTMKLYAAENISIDVTDGTINSTGSAAYDLDVAVGTPISGAAIQINSNDAYTVSKDTALTLSATGASWMKFSNDNITYSAYEFYGTSKAWDINNAAYGGTSSDGAKTVYVKYKDSFGNEAPVASDNIVYDTTVPVNPASAIDAQGAVTDTWQNNKNDPNFTSFTGESDANGIASFYVYFGTDSAGVTLDSIAIDAYNPASFTASNTRYLRVIAKDNAGFYADPDGAGATCTNTNADRPADFDCWSTIFIHKYDIDAPNTPSPVSSPISWTKTNSFDFSWTNPGDVGGSGVENYIYQTNAGTGATTTASTSVSGLASNADGTKLFSVKANDNAGNSGAEGSANFYYDSTPPVNAGTVTDGNGSLDNSWGVVADPDFTWTAGTDGASGVKEYDVYWGTDSSGTTVTVTSVANAYNPSAVPANTPYYLRIRTRDNALNESGWETKFTLKYSQSPFSPSGLSQTANSATLAFGDWTNDTTPALNFTLTDPESDTLGYIIKIDNNSDFSSPEVFYAYSNNDLVSGVEASFTVGQAAGTGAYTSGAEDQTLAGGQYYWKVQAVESHNLSSSEQTANSGGIAFKIDASAPADAVLSLSGISSGSITASVSGAVDFGSGLHAAPYYFENTTAGTNSGWQAGISWISSSLSCGTAYSFRVKTRDISGNESAFTALSSASTTGCGGGLPPAAYNPPASPPSSPTNPEAGFKIAINDNASQTNSQNINLELIAGSDTARMSISNNPDFIGAIQEPYQFSKIWTLSSGDGIKTVYARFYTSYGVSSQTVSDSIILDTTLPVIPSLSPLPLISPNIVNPAIPSVSPSPAFIPSVSSSPIPISTPVSTPFVSPQAIPSPSPSPEVPAIEAQPTPKPFTFNPDWNLLPVPKMEGIPVLFQPAEISFYARKFPSLSEIFKKLNISKVSDLVSRAPEASFNIPNLTEIIKTNFASLGAGSQINSFAPVPLVDLPAKVKKQIPSEIAFVSAAEKINLDSSLVLDEGFLKQKISAPSSSNLNISIKLDQSVRSVSGYLALKKSVYSLNDKLQMTNVKSISNDEMTNNQNNSNIENLSIGNLIEIRNLKLKILSLLGFKSAAAEEIKPADKPQAVETRFVLAQFQYADPDKDGIWTAGIQTPAVAGEYEIISLVNYRDPSIPDKEIRLITVIDPEGYAYEKSGDQELRIKNAAVSIYSLNPQTSQYELWSAQNYGQKNPQTTDSTGKYSFLVPAGSYYIKAESPGYQLYQSDVFVVSEAKNVHMNLEMKRKGDWKDIFTWERILLILLGIALAYNFYRDRRRANL